MITKILVLMSLLLLCKENGSKIFGPPEPQKVDGENSKAHVPLESQQVTKDVMASINNESLKNLKLEDVFSIGKNPGTGALIYKNSQQEEKISLGQNIGLYGFGMSFDGSLLAQNYQKDFSDSAIIQVAFGRLKSHLNGRIPQFLAATLVGEKPGKILQTYPVIVPKPKTKHNLKKMALILFSSPNTLSERLDEEKLQGTFFAETGSIQLSLIGKSKKVRVMVNSETLWFRVRLAKLVFNVTLGTPFIAEKGSLKGEVIIPLYSPDDKASTLFTRKLASESFNGVIDYSAESSTK